jgi:hypothetical protein
MTGPLANAMNQNAELQQTLKRAEQALIDLAKMPPMPIVETVMNMSVKMCQEYKDELQVNRLFLMACELVGYPQAKKEFDREGLNDDDPINDKVNRAMDLVQSLIDDEREDCYCSPAVRYGISGGLVCPNCQRKMNNEIPY